MAQSLIGKLRGRGRKRKAVVVKVKKTGGQETEAYKKRYLLLSGISLTVAANHVCVSEFRVRYICPWTNTEVCRRDDLSDVQAFSFRGTERSRIPDPRR